MMFMHRRLFIAIFFASALVFAAHGQEGPKNSVVLIIRHAEDADSGDGISPVGEKRAEAYKNYFLNYTRFGNSQSTDLAADLRANQQGKVILVCWRHPYIPALLGALGATPHTFLPNGKWPGSVYNWVIQLSFDQDGHLIPSSSRRINEQLMPGDP